MARDQLSCDLSGEIVILNVQSGLYFGLDLVGARVWELLQTPRTISELVEYLLDEYEVEPEACSHHLLELLAELQRRELIELVSEPLPTS